ncbi:MAG: aldo/keto reductase [Burkholderiaceae bacterium]|nr:aldo/keto reductase [Burkholderiaceae bacterium]
MQTRPLGNSGLDVTPLGFGAMHINDERVSEDEAAYLLNAVLDLGVNLIDTARGYGLSEQRIGQHLQHRRSEFLLSTKVGYGIAGVPDWTYDCIIAGVEAALVRMRCSHIDIVHLHSCRLTILEQGDVIRALEACVTSGKIRAAAYSGDNAEVDFAIECGQFSVIQSSVSVCDQINFVQRIPAMQAKGIGLIAKRPIAGAVWRRSERPNNDAEGAYWDRWQEMRLADALADISQLNPTEIALRFTAHAPGVATCIVGTSKLDHFEQNLQLVENGPLPQEIADLIRAKFLRHGAHWAGFI